MQEMGNLSSTRVAILGLGLMGGSLALALRGKCLEIIGVDTDKATLELAESMNLVHHISRNADEIINKADLIVIATPVYTIIEYLTELPEIHTNSAVIMDLGSTKERILDAMQALPERFDPIGGHPMCGKERGSLTNASADLFHGANFALVPLPRTTVMARTLAETLVKSVGAQPLWLDAETHDRWTAATSHLPYVLSNALAAVTSMETMPLIGPGFRSTTRLAVSPPSMWLDVLRSNRENLLAGLSLYLSHLELFEKHLEEGDWEALASLLQKGVQRREEMDDSDREES